MKPTITEKGQYKNLNLKPMEDGESIEVEKVFNEGKQIESQYQIEGKPKVYNYSVRVKYDGQDVSFWLNEKQHQEFKACGEVGSKISMTCSEEKYIDKKGNKKIKTDFCFKEVQ